MNIARFVSWLIWLDKIPTLEKREIIDWLNYKPYCEKEWRDGRVPLSFPVWQQEQETEAL